MSPDMAKAIVMIVFIVIFFASIQYIANMVGGYR
jgi:hypothetical protein